MGDPVEKSPEAPGSARCSQRRFSASRREKWRAPYLGVGFFGHFSQKKRCELVVDACNIVYEMKHIDNLFNHHVCLFLFYYLSSENHY